MVLRLRGPRLRPLVAFRRLSFPSHRRFRAGQLAAALPFCLGEFTSRTIVAQLSLGPDAAGVILLAFIRLDAESVFLNALSFFALPFRSSPFSSSKVDYMAPGKWRRDCGLWAPCRYAASVGCGRVCRLTWLPATSAGGIYSIPPFRGRPEGIASLRRYGTGTGCAACRSLRSWSIIPCCGQSLLGLYRLFLAVGRGFARTCPYCRSCPRRRPRRCSVGRSNIRGRRFPGPP